MSPINDSNSIPIEMGRITRTRSILVSFFLVRPTGGGSIQYATLDGIPRLTSVDVKERLLPNLAAKLEVDVSNIQLIAISALDNPNTPEQT